VGYSSGRQRGYRIRGALAIDRRIGGEPIPPAWSQRVGLIAGTEIIKHAGGGIEPATC